MQAIRTRFHGPSNVKGSRYSAKCEARTIYLSADHSLDSADNHRRACEELVKVMGWNTGKLAGGMVGGEFQHDHYWVFVNDMRTGDAS